MHLGQLLPCRSGELHAARRGSPTLQPPQSWLGATHISLGLDEASPSLPRTLRLRCSRLGVLYGLYSGACLFALTLALSKMFNW